MMQRLPRRQGFSERVRALMSQELPRGEPSLDRVAKRLKVSPRTLRRRLADEDTTFQLILDEVRKELAFSYLEDPSFGAEQAAFLLGFAEASSFRRAFKRWTGQTLAQYRGRA